MNKRVTVPETGLGIQSPVREMVVMRMAAVGKFIYHSVMFLGALACVLVFLKIEPKDFKTVFASLMWPHWLWLVAAITLYGLGMWSSLAAFRQGYKSPLLHKTDTLETKAAEKEKDLVNAVTAMGDEQLRKLIESDSDFVKRFNAIPFNKYRVLPFNPDEPERYPNTLAKRAFEVAKEVKDLLKKHGPEPKIEEHKVHGKEPLDWHYETIQPYRDRLNGGYGARIADAVKRTRDELAEQGFVDRELNQLLSKPFQTEESLQVIAQKLRFMASHLEDQ
jgi:hypothetical protein